MQNLYFLLDFFVFADSIYDNMTFRKQSMCVHSARFTLFGIIPWTHAFNVDFPYSGFPIRMLLKCGFSVFGVSLYN